MERSWGCHGIVAPPHWQVVGEKRVEVIGGEVAEDGLELEGTKSGFFHGFDEV